MEDQNGYNSMPDPRESLVFTERDSLLSPQTSSERRKAQSMFKMFLGLLLVGGLGIVGSIQSLDETSFDKYTTNFAKSSKESVRFSSLSLPEKMELFQEYKAKHKRLYKTPKEEKQRFANFLAHLNEADERNDKLQKAMAEQGKLPTTTYGITWMADLSTAERKALKGFRPENMPGLKSSGALKKVSGADYQMEFSIEFCSTCTRFPEMEAVTVDTLPTSFDWVSQGAVTPVRNQGVCGDCWSFSTSDNTAGAWFMAGNDLVQLSAQELTSCDEYSFGCDGGFFGSTFDWIIENGIMSEEEYPQSWETVYQGKTLMCKNDLLEGAQFKAGLDSWSSVSPTLDSEEELQLALLRNGPLSIGVDATSMEFYTGGVDQGIGCTGSVDHAIVLVGWGVENGEKYWLVKNSWGDIWGEDGYWKVVFGQDACNLADWVYSTYKSS